MGGACLQGGNLAAELRLGNGQGRRASRGLLQKSLQAAYLCLRSRSRFAKTADLFQTLIEVASKHLTRWCSGAPDIIANYQCLNDKDTFEDWPLKLDLTGVNRSGCGMHRCECKS